MDSIAQKINSNSQPIPPMPTSVAKKYGLNSLVIALSVLVFTLIFGIGFLYYQNIQLKKQPTSQNESGVSTPTPTSISVLEKRISYPFPKLNTWTEYQPKCLALSNNIRIFLPDGWKQSSSGEQSITDGTNAAKGTKEYEDFMSLTSQCQILLGYPEDPGTHQAAGAKEIFGSVWIQAWKVDLSQGEENSLAWWKNNNNNDKGYGGVYDVDSIVERRIGNRQWIQISQYNNKSENWLTINNDYVVNVQINNSFERSNPLLKGYIQETAEEIISKLIFK